MDQDFWTFLEYELSKAFANSSDPIKYFWCDGIPLPDSEKDFFQKIIEKGFISMKTFIGRMARMSKILF